MQVVVMGIVVMGTGTWGIRCQAKTTRQSYWHELRDHQKDFQWLIDRTIKYYMDKVLGRASRD